MSLRQKTIAGIIWTSLGTFGSGLIGFLVTLVMARHLSPSDFGVVEIVLSLVAISEVFIDCGFSQALIREKEVSQSDFSTVFFINMAVAIFLYTVIFLIAPSLSTFFSGGKSFILVLRVLSIKIIIDSIAICQNANCNRLMMFELQAKISVISMLVAGTLGIVSVYFGYGIWSIVTYYLVLSFSRCLLLSISMRWVPSFVVDIRRLRYFFSFGGVLMLLRIIDKTITSIESLSIGKIYSKQDLGYYSQARRFDSLVIQNMVGIVQKVTYPALSRLSTEERLRQGYKELMKVSVWLISPIALFMLFNSRSFMSVIFGSQWLASAPYLCAFAFFSMIYPLYNICWNIFLVKAKTRNMLWIGLGKQSVRLLVLFITIHYSILIFTVGIVSVMVISSLVYVYFSGKIINYPLRNMLLDNVGSVLTATFSCMLVSTTYHCLHVPEQNLLFFAINIISTILIYSICSLVLKNKAFFLVTAIIKDLVQNVKRH